VEKVKVRHKGEKKERTVKKRDGNLEKHPGLRRGEDDGHGYSKNQTNQKTIEPTNAVGK